MICISVFLILPICWIFSRRIYNPPPAIGLYDLVIIGQYDDIRVVPGGQLSLSPIFAEKPGRIDCAGIQRRVKGDHRLFHQEFQAAVHAQRASGQRAAVF